MVSWQPLARMQKFNKNKKSNMSAWMAAVEQKEPYA